MRILLIAEPTSIHAARWANQLVGSNHEIALASGADTIEYVSPDLGAIPVWGEVEKPDDRDIRELPPGTTHEERLAGLISAYRPDVVHLAGMYANAHNGGVTLVGALRRCDPARKIPCLYSSWGTDLDYFARMPEHGLDVRWVLERMDFHVPECRRDAELAKKFGFQGTTLEPLPAFGGTTWLPESMGCRPVVNRVGVLLKARDISEGDPIGRGMTAVLGLVGCQDVLRGYQVRLMQSAGTVQYHAERVRELYGVSVHGLARSTYHREVVALMSQARVYVALTINDGLPSSLIEAMSVGTFPIHSRLDSVSEWITDGENGLLVEPEDVVGFGIALRRALTDQDLVLRAAEINQRLVAERLSAEVIQPKALAVYEIARGYSHPEYASVLT